MPGLPAGLLGPDDFAAAAAAAAAGGHTLTSAGLPLMGTVNSVHNSNSSIGANAGSTGRLSMRDTASMAGSPGAGPIRNRSRMNTSPYGSDRHGGGGSGGGGNHLSPPDPSWRRVVSDSAIHKSVGVSYDNAMGGAQGLMLAQGGLQMGGSPLQGASPTLLRRECE